MWLHSCSISWLGFLDAEAMPESLRYEELVRRNVVGLAHRGGSSGDALGPSVQGRTHWSFRRNSSLPRPRSLSRRQS